MNSSNVDSEEICPDDANSTAVYNGQDPQYNTDRQDFMEGSLAAGAIGNVMKTNVGLSLRPAGIA